MHRRVAPAFVEETAGLVEVVEIVGIRLGAQEGEGCNFEVGPLYVFGPGD